MVLPTISAPPLGQQFGVVNRPHLIVLSGIPERQFINMNSRNMMRLRHVGLPRLLA
jgi:hypothetical protein